MPVAVTVRRARPDEVDAVAGVLVEGLAASPLVRWLIPDPPVRRRCFAILVEHALAGGYVDLAVSRRTDRPLGVAVWWDSARSGSPTGYGIHEVQGAVPPLWWERLEALERSLEERRLLAGRRLARLASLAVRPPMQGRGIGTLLLRHWHSVVDAAGAVALQYAFTSGSRDYLCKQYGYESAGDPVRVSARGLPVWPLWREPVPVAAGDGDRAV